MTEAMGKPMTEIEPCPCGCGSPSIGGRVVADHPHLDPGDGRTECVTCGKWVWLVTHSCKGVPVTLAAAQRLALALHDCRPDENFGSWARCSGCGRTFP